MTRALIESRSPAGPPDFHSSAVESAADTSSVMPSSNLSFANEYDLVAAGNQGLGQLFYYKAQERPCSIAVVDGEICFTYAQLHDKATALAQQLLQRGLRCEESVGIVTQHGFADIVAQLGIIYAGGSCTPVDPTLSDKQIQRRLSRLDTRFILTDRINQFRAIAYHKILVDHNNTEIAVNAAAFRPVPTTLEHCGHLIHTSGTTGEPKAVRIAARSILHVAFHAPLEPVQITDTVAHVNNSSFDVSLFDIWAPLLQGGRAVVLSKAILLDPMLMAQEIDRLGITVMATTTAILNLAAFSFPQAFARLRVCFFGGEAANMAAVKRVFEAGPPEILVNAYGPTECCIFCLTRQVTWKDIDAGRVSLGTPIGRNLAYIMSDEETPSEEGELWIGGPGVSPGYANYSEKNKTSFRTIAASSPTGVGPIRLYKTGDIVRRRPDGQIDYVARQDHQVKIRGFRVELEAVEEALLNTSLLTEAVAMRVELPQRGAGSILVAYAVPVDVDHPPVVDHVLEKVHETLPPYMIPQLELIPLMPLNSHAKVDRRLLTDLFNQRWEKTSESKICGESRDVRSILLDIWSKILASSTIAYEDGDDFLKLGGTSLQAALLISQIRQAFGIEISLLTFYSDTTMRGLTSIIAERLAGQLEMLKDDRDLWIADSKLGDGMNLPPGPPVDWKTENEGRVFFTGATGFVGSFLLASLVSMPCVREVACLVRAKDSTAGLHRLQATMKKYGIWKESFASKIQAIPGRLEDDHLGLTPQAFGEIALRSSAIFHLGAHVNYAQPYSMHRPANTLGTRNIVRLACSGRLKPVHYVSSISCFGPTGSITGAKLVRENDPLVPHLAALPFDHGYAQSQWVADEMLCRLAARGFPITIYRPGFVTGHSQTGACNADDFFSRLIDACCEMGCYPQLPNQRKEFVPVDYVCDAILHIAASPASLGQAYHIVPPTRATSIDMDNTMNLVAEVAGKEVRGVPYVEWTKQLGSVSPERLLPLQPMLMEKVWEGRTRWELYENMPVYDTTNTVKALADYPGGLAFPVLDGSLMRRYMKYLR